MRGTLIALTCGVALALLLADAPDPPAPAASATATPAPEARYHWPAGTVHAYQVELEDSGRVDVPGLEADAPLVVEGALALAGVLVIEVVEADGAGAELIARLETLDRVSWAIQGQDVPEPERLLLGHRAFVRVGGEGAVGEVRFEQGAPKSYAQVMERLVRQAVVPLSGAEERGAYGVAPWRVELGCGPGACRLSAERSGADYAELSFVPSHLDFDGIAGAASGQVALTRSGLLQRSEVDEALTLTRRGAPIAEAEWRSRLVWLGARSEPALTGGPERKVSAAELGPGRREALVQRAAGMTFAQVEADLLRYGAGGMMPHHERWLWRVSGLMRLDPSLAGHLADLALADDTPMGTRRLVLDLLAGVGHAQAQAALRRMLASEVLARDASFPRYVQRAILVRRPEPETVALVAALYQSREGHSRYASAVAWGGALGQLRRWDPEAAAAGADAIASELRQAEDPSEQRALLMGLAASRQGGHEALIAGFAESDDPHLRRAAVGALAHVPTGAPLLARLAGDGDHLVRGYALDVLRGHPLDDAALEALARSAALPEAGRSAGSFVTLVERLVGEGLSPADDARRVLEALWHSSGPDRASRHAIARAMRRLDLAQR